MNAPKLHISKHRAAGGIMPLPLTYLFGRMVQWARQIRVRLRKTDRNAGGLDAATPRRRRTGIERHFTALDADSNGLISRDETTDVTARHPAQACDNRNIAISREQLNTGTRSEKSSDDCRAAQ